MFEPKNLRRGPDARAGWLTGLAAALAWLCAADPPPPQTPALKERVIVFFDTETTGFSASKDRIIELGAVKIENGRIVAEKNWLIQPDRPIHPSAQAVHGITAEMLKDKPRFAEIYPEFKAFAGDAVLMAHNAPFDVRFLREEIRRISGEPLPENTVICTLSLFRRWMPGEPNYTLEHLAEKLQVEQGDFHRATDDARFTARIFLKMLERRTGEPPTLESIQAEGARTYRIAP